MQRRWDGGVQIEGFARRARGTAKALGVPDRERTTTIIKKEWTAARARARATDSTLRRAAVVVLLAAQMGCPARWTAAVGCEEELNSGETIARLTAHGHITINFRSLCLVQTRRDEVVLAAAPLSACVAHGAPLHAATTGALARRAHVYAARSGISTRIAPAAPARAAASGHRCRC